MKRNVLMAVLLILFLSSGVVFLDSAFSQEKAEEVSEPEAALEEETEVKEQVLEVKEYALCTGVEDRQPVNKRTTFTQDVGRVYLWINIYGAEEPTQIKHRWHYKGQNMAEVSLDIKYPYYRTWSYKTILPQWVGDWTVDVVDAKGSVLQEISFVIESGVTPEEETEELPEGPLETEE